MKKFILSLVLLLTCLVCNAQFTPSTYTPVGRSVPTTKPFTYNPPKVHYQIIMATAQTTTGWTTVKLKVASDENGYYVAAYQNGYGWINVPKAYLQEIPDYSQYSQYYTYTAFVGCMTVFI